MTMSLQDGSLATVRRDLELAVDWHDLRQLALPGTRWTVVIGHKRRSDALRVVVPLPLHSTSLNAPELKAIFDSIATLSSADIPQPMDRLAPVVAQLQAQYASSRITAHGEQVSLQVKEGEEEEAHNESLDRDTIYMAIVTTDATVVYYRLSRGLKKPTDVPDE